MLDVARELVPSWFEEVKREGSREFRSEHLTMWFEKFGNRWFMQVRLVAEADDDWNAGFELPSDFFILKDKAFQNMCKDWIAAYEHAIGTLI